MKRFAFAALAAISFGLPVFTGPVFAGPQFVDQTGFAVSGYDVVAYRSLDQSAVGQPQAAAIPGRADITAEYNGAKFAFASEENRAKFLENPAYFVPQYDGHCAYGVSKGGKVPGNPNLWRIVDDRLYLNITKTLLGFGKRILAETSISPKATGQGSSQRRLRVDLSPISPPAHLGSDCLGCDYQGADNLRSDPVWFAVIALVLAPR